VQRELAQTDLDGVGDMRGDRMGGGKERELGGGLAVGVKDRDGLGPGGFLAVVDLAQVEELALDPRAAGGADFFSDRPVAVVLAILEAVVAVQKRLAHNFAGHFTESAAGEKGVGLHQTRLGESNPGKDWAFWLGQPRK
jgi:hypothetical protein